MRKNQGTSVAHLRVRHSIQVLAIIIVLFSAALSSRAEDIQIAVEDSGSKEVDALVLQLVSQRPAPFPSGCTDSAIDMVRLPYMTLQVSNAITKLKAMGPRIFPNLVKHLGDDRYSFSDTSAAWDNLTVSEAVINVLSDGHEMHSGYKGRKTASGYATYLSFSAYLKAKAPEKWAEWAKTQTRLAIQWDFIDWCIAKEKERGFVDKTQEAEVLKRYEEARERVQRQYAEKEGDVNEKRLISSRTNSAR